MALGYGCGQVVDPEFALFIASPTSSSNSPEPPIAVFIQERLRARRYVFETSNQQRLQLCSAKPPVKVWKTQLELKQFVHSFGNPQWRHPNLTKDLWSLLCFVKSLTYIQGLLRHCQRTLLGILLENFQQSWNKKMMKLIWKSWLRSWEKWWNKLKESTAKDSLWKRYKQHSQQ